MVTGKQLKAAILARRAAKGPRKKRTRPEPRQYTIADLERARDRVAAAERRIDNDRSSNPNRGRAGLERAQLELAVIEAQLRLRGPLSNGSIELFRHPGEHVEGPRSRLRRKTRPGDQAASGRRPPSCRSGRVAAGVYSLWNGVNALAWRSKKCRRSSGSCSRASVTARFFISAMPDALSSV